MNQDVRIKISDGMELLLPEDGR